MVLGESMTLILVRYLEANAHRAKLTKKAEDWKYGSLHERVKRNRELLSEAYVTLYDEWVKYVNQPLREGELENIRNSVNRQAPLGEEQWQVETATKYGMMSTLRRRGRPSL
jgi:putative transposase